MAPSVDGAIFISLSTSEVKRSPDLGEINSLTPETAGIKAHSSGEINFSLPLDRKTGSLLPDTVNVSLDYVVFQDGSEWGPDTRRQREAIQAMREGAEMEHTLGKAQQ